MKKYVKKPVVIEAVQFNGTEENYKYIEQWSNGKAYIRGTNLPEEQRELEIQTLEGEMRAKVSYYIVKGVKGEVWPVREDIFHETYQEIPKWQKGPDGF